MNFSYFIKTSLLLLFLLIQSCSEEEGNNTEKDDGSSSTTVSIASTTVTESNSGTVNLIFTVTLSEANDGTTVDYATSDITATTADNDYIAKTGQVIFTSGSTSETISVVVNGDTTIEDNETMLVTLSNPSNNVQLQVSTAGGVINNDDSASSTIVSASIATSTITEGNLATSNITFTVTLSSASDGTTIDFATSDFTATTADNDYVAKSGTVTFNGGSTSETITVIVNGDTVPENQEGFNVTLSNASNGIQIATNSAVGVILNDDTAPAAVTVSINNATVTEGDSGQKFLAFTVSLSAVKDLSSVTFSTSDGTATTADGDYNSQTSAVIFTSGLTSQIVNIIINGDTKLETDETITVTLSNPTGGISIATSTATGTITNDDSAFLSTVSIANASITEGDTGTTTLTVNLTLDTFTNTSSVDFTTSNGTATTANSDYVNKTGTVTFTGGSKAESISIIVNGDTLAELDEVFTLTLSNPSNLQIGNATATLTIRDDDTRSRLNDTGITKAGLRTTEQIKTSADCSNSTFTAKQDCDYGRDATHNDNSDGIAGFSFSKLDASGSALTDQTAINHACVKDNVTGYYWEIKTDSGDRDYRTKYKWGGLTAIGRNHTNKEGIYEDDWNVLVNAANNTSLCGFNNWRMPTISELHSIVNYGFTSGTLDGSYFPKAINVLNTNSNYWSATPSANYNGHAFLLDFKNGTETRNNRSFTYYARLMRNNP